MRINFLGSKKVYARELFGIGFQIRLHPPQSSGMRDRSATEARLTQGATLNIRRRASV